MQISHFRESIIEKFLNLETDKHVIEKTTEREKTTRGEQWGAIVYLATKKNPIMREERKEWKRYLK